MEATPPKMKDQEDTDAYGSENMKKEQTEQDPERVYDEVYGINYGNIINGSPDYTGCGLFPEEGEATDPSGFRYKYGISADPVEPFNLRDAKMLKLINENMPTDR